jgi:hypothetical protein
MAEPVPPELEPSWRLPVALIAVSAITVVAALLTPTSGVVETFVILGRTTVFAILAWLAFRRTWARWLLVAWLTYGVIVVMSSLLAGLYRANVAVVLVIVVSIWTCLELGIAMAAGPPAKSGWRA